MGHAQPLHGVQRIIQKMGVQLCLHHAQSGLIQFPLSLDRPVQVDQILLRHVVEPAGKTAQFVRPVRLQAHVQAAPLHLAHSLVQLMNGLRQIAAENPGAEQAQYQAQRPHQSAGEVNGPHDQGRKGPGLLQHKHKTGCFMASGEKTVPLPLSRERTLLQQLPPEGIRCLGGLGGPGIIHRPPAPVQQQHLAGSRILSAEEAFEASLFHYGHHISENSAAVVAYRLGGGQSPAVRSPEDGSLRLPGSPEDAPVHLQRSAGKSGGGIAAQPVPVIYLHTHLVPHGRSGPGQNLVQRPGVPTAPPEGGADDRAVRKLADHRPAVLLKAAQGGGESRQLFLRLTGQALLAAHNQKAHHQRPAQQQREQNRQQNRHKDPVPEGLAHPRPHCCPSSSRHCCKMASRSAAALSRS